MKKTAAAAIANKIESMEENTAMIGDDIKPILPIEAVSTAATKQPEYIQSDMKKLYRRLVKEAELEAETELKEMGLEVTTKPVETWRRCFDLSRKKLVQKSREFDPKLKEKLDKYMKARREKISSKRNTSLKHCCKRTENFRTFVRSKVLICSFVCS